MKNARALTARFAIVLLSLIATTTTATDSVSPGAVDRIATIEQRCPTFSWGGDDGAAVYELVAYVLPEDGAQPVVLTGETEALYTRVAGSATSWTPSAEQCFAPDGRYVWFVRAVTQMIDDQVVEAGEWSAPRYFDVPAGPTEAEVARAIEVLKRWEARNEESATSSAGMRSGAPRPTLRRLGSGGVVADSGTGSGSSHRKSVPTASAAIRGEHPSFTGESYGVVGTASSPDGAGVAAAHLDGGPDLVLDGSVDGEADTRLWEWGIDRASATDESFLLTNSGVGRLHLDVNGDIFGDTIDIEEIKINGSTVVDDTGEWMGLGSTVPCSGCVGSVDIADGAVATADLADSSVDYQKIALGNIRTGHLQNGAVRTDKIDDGAVTAPKLADGAVTSSKLGAGAVVSSAIRANAVTGAAIADGTITGADISRVAALDASTLDGQGSAFYRNASNINGGTLATSRYSAVADLSAEGLLGNAPGDIAVNNGVLQENLDADRVDGLDAESFQPRITIAESSPNTNYYLTDSCSLAIGQGITITTDGPGSLLVTADVMVGVEMSGALKVIHLALSDSAAQCDDFVSWKPPLNAGSTSEFLTLREVIPISSAGSHHIYLNVKTHLGYEFETDYVARAHYVAVFFPG